MAGAKIKVSIYDPILIFAWYKVVPDKPELEEVQQDIFRCFMGSFDALGKVFNLNRRLDNRLASRIFQKANDIRVQEIRRFPGSFRMGSCSYDRENGVIRYSFTQCPNAIRQAAPHGGRAARHVQLRSYRRAEAPRQPDPGRNVRGIALLRLLHRGRPSSPRTGL